MQLEFHQLDRRWEHLRGREPHRQRRLLPGSGVANVPAYVNVRIIPAKTARPSAGR